jgi:hypothetical protein
MASNEYDGKVGGIFRKKRGMRNEGVPQGSKISIFGVPGVRIGSNLFTKYGKFIIQTLIEGP